VIVIVIVNVLVCILIQIFEILSVFSVLLSVMLSLCDLSRDAVVVDCCIEFCPSTAAAADLHCTRHWTLRV